MGNTTGTISWNRCQYDDNIVDDIFDLIDKYDLTEAEIGWAENIPGTHAISVRAKGIFGAEGSINAFLCDAREKIEDYTFLSGNAIVTSITRTKWSKKF